MTLRTTKIDRMIRKWLHEALDPVGVPWQIEQGKKHRLIRVREDNHLLARYPNGSDRGSDFLNIQQAIKRVAEAARVSH